jgi:hypothetical protein
MGRTRAHSVGTAQHVRLDEGRRHGRRGVCSSTVRSLCRLQAVASARNHHLDDHGRKRRELAVSPISPGKVAAPPFWLPTRSRLGGTTRTEHPATAASSLGSRLEFRGAHLLRDPKPQRGAAQRGASRARPANAPSNALKERHSICGLATNPMAMLSLPMGDGIWPTFDASFTR